jgi:hypothetical protein
MAAEVVAEAVEVAEVVAAEDAAAEVAAAAGSGDIATCANAAAGQLDAVLPLPLIAAQAGIQH